MKTELVESATRSGLPASVYSIIKVLGMVITPNLMGMLLNITQNNNGKRGAQCRPKNT